MYIYTPISPILLIFYSFRLYAGNRSNAAMDTLFRYLIRFGRLDYHIWTMVEQQLGFVRNSPVLMEYLRSVLNQAYSVAGSIDERATVAELNTIAPLDPPIDVDASPDDVFAADTTSLSSVPSWYELKTSPNPAIKKRYAAIFEVCCYMHSI